MEWGSVTDDKDREIADLQARLAALESQARPSASSPSPPTSPVKGSKEQGCAIAVFAVLAIIGLLAYCGSQESSTSTSTLTAVGTASSWTPPEGYTLVTYAGGNNSRMGTKWVTPTNDECRGSGRACFAMEVVTEKPCYRSLYASITLLSAGDENIGWTNDTAQGVEAGETVRLVFNTHERGVEAARIAEINCY